MAADGRAPLYQRIKADLRAAVDRGEYEAGGPFVTQRELCARYGVSTTTAVKALNDLVAEGLLTRRQGRGTYVAERTERAGDPGTPRTIACIVHGLRGTHVSTVVSGVESVCAELGYRMYLTDTARRDVLASPRREATALTEALLSPVAGIVLYPVEGAHNAALLSRIRRRGIPLVLVDRYRTDVPTDAVMVNNVALGYQLTRHLIAAGHERILTLWSETRVTSVQDRLAGHVRALRERGLAVSPELTALRPYGEQPEPVRLALLRSALDAADPPTAALCANGYVVATVARDLVTVGRSVPGDVALAGMDDAGPVDLLGLATVTAALPSAELGATAMRLVAQRIAGATDDPRHVTLPTEVRTRDARAGYLRAVGGDHA